VAFWLAGKAGASATPSNTRAAKMPAKAAGDSGDGGCHGPEKAAPAPDPRHSEPIKHHASWHLEQRVGPEERAEQQPELLRGQMEVHLQLWSRDREIDPVDVVNQHANAKQHSDRPTPSGNALRVWYHCGSFPPPDALSEAWRDVRRIAGGLDLAT
jgi:hypothetical protein